MVLFKASLLALVALAASAAPSLKDRVARLERIAGGLAKVDAPQVRQLLTPFLTELHAVAANPTEDSVAAAESAVAGLSADLTQHEQDLGAAQTADETSVLLGVLLSRSKDAPVRQLEVVEDAEFAELPVVKKFLSQQTLGWLQAAAKRGELATEAAAWLDGHKVVASPAVTQAVAKADAAPTAPTASAGRDGVASALAKLADRSMKNVRDEEESFEHRLKKFDLVAAKKEPDVPGEKTNRVAKLLKQMRQKEVRTHQKKVVGMLKNVKAIKEAEAAVKSGDPGALQAARKQLSRALKKLRAAQGDFLVLLQSEATDCPYCKAQCIEKCHNNGRNFALCLGDCATAGP